jgi:hypothetical protein
MAEREGFSFACPAKPHWINKIKRSLAPNAGLCSYFLRVESYCVIALCINAKAQEVSHQCHKDRLPDVDSYAA